MRQQLIKRLQGIALLATICVAAGGALVAAYLPIMEAREGIADARDRIERFQASLSRDRLAKTVDVSDVIHPDGPTAASLVVQRILVDICQASGLAQKELRTHPERKLDRGIVQQPFGLVVTGDLDHWTLFMKELSTRRPAVFVDGVTFLIGSAHRGDIAMTIEMQLSSYAMGSGSPS